MFFFVRGYKGFKFRIYPSEKQELRLLAWESALRFLWNLALEQRKLGLGRPVPLYPKAFDQINELKTLCVDLPFLAGRAGARPVRPRTALTGCVSRPRARSVAVARRSNRRASR